MFIFNVLLAYLLMCVWFIRDLMMFHGKFRFSVKLHEHRYFTEQAFRILLMQMGSNQNSLALRRNLSLARYLHVWNFVIEICEFPRRRGVLWEKYKEAGRRKLISQLCNCRGKRRWPGPIFEAIQLRLKSEARCELSHRFHADY